ncbi:MAG: hypothetical protein U0M66_01955 [Bacilli bacterium]|nr:hypothetical protein [Bacilli bacterium]
MLLPKRFVNWKSISKDSEKYEQEELNKTVPVVLDDKVEEFIDWFTENMVKGHYDDIQTYSIPINMRNIIEKMAVWYELRYPDYEINRIIPCLSSEQIDIMNIIDKKERAYKNINEVMFKNNQYTNDILDKNSEIKDLDWNEFYNAKAFINSLPPCERYVFSRPRYQNIVYLFFKGCIPHLHLTSNGFIETAEYMNNMIPGITNKGLEGKNIKEVVSMLKEKGVRLPKDSELEKAIRDYDNWVYQKEEMLNCVMYRIIERGGSIYGPRRAFIFAKEFGRNIDIPMAYGVDKSDTCLRLFMNEYLKAGGSKDLVCYVGYGSRASKYEKLPTITMQELIMTQNNNSTSFYTPEENELHQKLVNALCNWANQNELPKEKGGSKTIKLKKQNH